MKTFIPPIEMNDKLLKILGPVIMVGMFFLEILGAFIRGFVLAVRLFANMLAGHTVLFVLLVFIRMIGQASDPATYPDAYSGTANLLFWPITGASVLLVTAMSVLELFVACLQAFVFTFLTAVFIGLAKHPAH